MAHFCVKSIDVTAAVKRACGLEVEVSEIEVIAACSKVIEVCIRTDPRIATAPIFLKKKDAAQIIRTLSDQLAHFIFDTTLALQRGWFKEVSSKEDLTNKLKYVKMDWFEGEKIIKVDRTVTEYIDSRSH